MHHGVRVAFVVKLTQRTYIVLLKRSVFHVHQYSVLIVLNFCSSQSISWYGTANASGLQLWPSRNQTVQGLLSNVKWEIRPSLVLYSLSSSSSTRIRQTKRFSLLACKGNFTLENYEGCKQLCHALLILFMINLLLLNVIVIPDYFQLYCSLGDKSRPWCVWCSFLWWPPSKGTHWESIY